MVFVAVRESYSAISLFRADDSDGNCATHGENHPSVGIASRPHSEPYPYGSRGVQAMARKLAVRVSNITTPTDYASESPNGTKKNNKLIFGRCSFCSRLQLETCRASSAEQRTESCAPPRIEHAQCSIFPLCDSVSVQDKIRLFEAKFAEINR